MIQFGMHNYNQKWSRTRTYLFLLFILFPAAYFGFVGTYRVTSGLVTPSTITVYISLGIATLLIGLIATSKTFSRGSRIEHLKFLLGAWIGIVIFMIIGLANLEQFAPFNQKGHCYRQLISKRASTDMRRTPDNYKFLFFDFGGRDGTSDIGVDPETYGQFGTPGNLFELELNRGFFGSVSLVSITLNQNAPVGLIKEPCW